MNPKNTRARATGAESAYPAHGQQLAIKQRQGVGYMWPICRLILVTLLTLILLHRQYTSAHRLIAKALSSLTDPEKTQMQEWIEKPESHERVAVGETTGRTAQKIEEFFRDVEGGVRGNTQ